MKFKGDIHVNFLEPIMPGLERNKFIEVIENKIYSEEKKYY